MRNDPAGAGKQSDATVCLRGAIKVSWFLFLKIS